MNDDIKRRELLFSAAALASAAGLMASREASAAMGKGAEKIDQRNDGTYSTVELIKPVWNLGVMQSRVRAVQMDNYKREIADNLAHMLDLIDKTFYYGPKPDVLFFHEFPITGWQRWSRDEILKFAIEVPGEETEKIAAKARQYNSWIVFGSYVRDKDWPGHVLSITTIIDNKGQIAAKHWKARNIKGGFASGFELFTTTIYDALDRYIEMYGVDEVIPVTRTPLGNLCTSSIQREPELFRAMAFKGAEVILRTASGGFTPLDIQATSLYNNVYTAVVNNSVSPGNKNFFAESGSGSGGSSGNSPCRGWTVSGVVSAARGGATRRAPTAAPPLPPPPPSLACTRPRSSTSCRGTTASPATRCPLKRTSNTWEGGWADRRLCGQLGQADPVGGAGQPCSSTGRMRRRPRRPPLTPCSSPPPRLDADQVVHIPHQVGGGQGQLHRLKKGGVTTCAHRTRLAALPRGHHAHHPVSLEPQDPAPGGGTGQTGRLSGSHDEQAALQIVDRARCRHVAVGGPGGRPPPAAPAHRRHSSPPGGCRTRRFQLFRRELVVDRLAAGGNGRAAGRVCRTWPPGTPPPTTRHPQPLHRPFLLP